MIDFKYHYRRFKFLLKFWKSIPDNYNDAIRLFLEKGYMGTARFNCVLCGEKSDWLLNIEALSVCSDHLVDEHGYLVDDFKED